MQNVCIYVYINYTKIGREKRHRLFTHIVDQWIRACLSGQSLVLKHENTENNIDFHAP